MFIHIHKCGAAPVAVLSFLPARFLPKGRAAISVGGCKVEQKPEDNLQDEQHEADYSLVGDFHDKPSALVAIDNAENLIGLLGQAKIQDRRGFVAHVLFKRRPS